MNIFYSIKIPQRSWTTKILIGSWGCPNWVIRMAVNPVKGGGLLVGDWDYFSQDVNEKEVSLLLVLVEKSVLFLIHRTDPCKPYDANLSKLCGFKVAPYSFLSARALISKISRWCKLSKSTPKSRAGSRSKMPTDMASKLLKFVYRKCCVDRLQFQNICRLNRRPQLSLLDLKRKIYEACRSFNQ